MLRSWDGSSYNVASRGMEEEEDAGGGGCWWRRMMLEKARTPAPMRDGGGGVDAETPQPRDGTLECGLRGRRCFFNLKKNIYIYPNHVSTITDS